LIRRGLGGGGTVHLSTKEFQMARYRANKLGFDGKQLREPGEEFDFDGEPGHWMDALDASGRTKKDILAKASEGHGK
jgi:hypothetical protein